MIKDEKYIPSLWFSIFCVVGFGLFLSSESRSCAVEGTGVSRFFCYLSFLSPASAGIVLLLLSFYFWRSQDKPKAKIVLVLVPFTFAFFYAISTVVRVLGS